MITTACACGRVGTDRDQWDGEAVREASVGEKLLGLGDVRLGLRDRLVPEQHLVGEERVRDLGVPLVRKGVHPAEVERGLNCLAHLDVVERLALQRQRHEVDTGGVEQVDAEFRVRLDLLQHVARRVLDDVDLAALQLQEAGVVVGHDAHLDGGDLGLGAPVVVVAGENETALRRQAGHLERSGSVRRLVEEVLVGFNGLLRQHGVGVHREVGE